jgi:hypothetical protein
MWREWGHAVRKFDWNRLLGKPRRRWMNDILILSFMKWDGPMDWTDLAQDMARWLALVNAVTKSEFYKMRWSSCIAEELHKKDCAPWSLVSYSFALLCL